MKANFETNKKICCKCRIEKDIQAFTKDKCTSDGLQSRCKQCAKKVNKENYYFYNPREVNYPIAKDDWASCFTVS